MQHVRVAVYRFKAGAADEAIARARGGLLPIFQGQPGFVAYGVVKSGDDAGVSISVWQTQAEAEAAVQTAGSWVQANIGALVDAVQNHVGELSFFVAAATIGS